MLLCQTEFSSENDCMMLVIAEFLAIANLSLICVKCEKYVGKMYYILKLNNQHEKH